MTWVAWIPPSGGTAAQLDRHFMTSVAVAVRAEATVAHIDRHFMTCGGCGPPSGGTAAQVDRHFMTSVAVAVRAEATVAHIDRHFMTSVAGPSGDAAQPVCRRFTGIPRWNRVRVGTCNLMGHCADHCSWITLYGSVPIKEKKMKATRWRSARKRSPILVEIVFDFASR